jgi:hypothetical protein
MTNDERHIRDEHRTKCLKAINAALGWHGVVDSAKVALSVFDALHGIALVLAPDIFSNVINGALYQGAQLRMVVDEDFDLTNPPDPFGTSTEAPK